eukprot:5522580-Pyramimonas_sp.AAC.1
MEVCWNPNPGCAPQAENKCPGKANKPEGACRHQCAGIARTFVTSVTCNGYARSATPWTNTTAHTSSCSLFKTRPG